MQETHEITIDTEFKDLLPPLDAETYKSLEENIIANGCMFPLVLWNNILIDGHNRYAVCTEHDIPYSVTEKEFATREDVLLWIISNQVARRNLTPMQLTYFRGLHYNTVKVMVKNPLGVNQHSEVNSDNPNKPQKLTTAEQLSKHYKVHRDTIFTDSKASNGIDAVGRVSPEAKGKILSGDVSIDKKELQRLASADDDEIKEVATQIADGTYNKSKPGETGFSDINDSSRSASETGTSKSHVIKAVTGSEHRAVIDAATRNSSQIKAVLKAYITVLEDVYKGL